jgi:flagellar biogenesis protein FliO
MELRQVLSVLLVFALLGGALFVLRRGGLVALRGSLMRSSIGKPREKSLKSIERLALTPQHSLHLIRIQGRDFVVATHPQGCGLLTEVSEAAGKGVGA